MAGGTGEGRAFGRWRKLSDHSGALRLAAAASLALGLLNFAAISAVAESSNSQAKSDPVIKADSVAVTGAIDSVPAPVRQITLTRNKSRTIELHAPFSAAVVGAPNIADVLPMSDTMLYIQGKEFGTTNISVFDKEKRLIAVIDIQVTIDAQQISRNIQQSIGSPAIKVSAAHDQVILSGTARDAADVERAVAIAKAMAPGAAVINAMRIGQPQQVMLKVRYLEASRSAAREIGVNWFGSNDNGTRGGSTGLGLPTGPAPSLDPRQVQDLSVLRGLTTFASGTTAEPFATVIASILDRGFNLDVMISALEQKGLVRLLAEPNLVALSGDEAKFHAGGKIPVPVATPTGDGSVSVTIQFQPFGVELSFEPTVLQNGIINLSLEPSVSQLDYSNAVILGGFRIPALTTRKTKTTVELRSGQSFAISGLLQNEGLRDIAQVPWLGTLPILGALFRSTSYQQNETDLVVIVTPHLVAPAAPGQQLSTPLDQRIPSNDRDLFLHGRLDLPKAYADYVSTGGEINGPYGHILIDESGGYSDSSGVRGTWK
jgi:pilus assembly protein CpaC